ncbi:Uncharacterized membrane protein YczE [Cetobacterium ceti]|uniref:Uncharacterized membrane protein YczE n=1 Tax=Cetobacterium ceti TaxID=180163 RepID=A0A1T4MG39_9FUSO|nr:hypothetical protein [Cetobacterium ceti]SJZ66060.1 Uncharacterized membrane protein YczE [Cetobacterium ceti]
MNYTLKGLGYSIFFYMFTAVGISLVIEAAVGVSCLDAMNLSISEISKFKIGTLTIFSNFLFIIGDILITRFSNPIKYVLQGISILALGIVINIIIYYIFPHVNINNYSVKLFLYILGTLIAGVSIGAIIKLNFLSFPVENFCLTISEKYKISFVKIRYSIDVIALIASIILSYSFELPFFIREGTIIGMIMFSPIVNFTKDKVKF